MVMCDTSHVCGSTLGTLASRHARFCKIFKNTVLGRRSFDNRAQTTGIRKEAVVEVTAGGVSPIESKILRFFEIGSDGRAWSA